MMLYRYKRCCAHHQVSLWCYLSLFVILVYLEQRVIAQSVADFLPDITREYISPDDSFATAWLLNGTNITFVVRGKTTGWVGIGWNHVPSMLDADMIVSSVIDNSSTIMIDRNTLGFLFYGEPKNDGPDHQDFTFHWGFVTDTQTYFSFTRLLSTGDGADLDILSCQYLLFAMGANGDTITSTDLFNQHPHAGTVLSVEWENNTTLNVIQTERNLALIKIHAGFMVFGVLYLAVLAGVIPRFLKKALGHNSLWLFLHGSMQFAALCFVFIGLGFAVVFIDGSPLHNNQTAHRILGYILLSLIGLQALIGSTLTSTFQPLKQEEPKPRSLQLVTIFHKLTGYLILLIGFVNAWLGLSDFNSLPETSLTGTSTSSWGLMSVYIGCSIGLWCIFQLLNFLNVTAQRVYLGLWVFWIIFGLGLLLPTVILIENH